MIKNTPVHFNKLISIIIPTFNQGQFLDRALKSVINQTYTNWEVIIVDNHSSDNTSKIVKSFKNPKITYFKIHNNGIIAKSRNAGISAANGKWIAFLDSDDWWANDKLEKCAIYLGNEVDLVYHDLKIIYEKQKLFRKRSIKSRQLYNPVLIDLLVGGNIISNSSVIVRKSLIEKIGGISENEKLIAAEDYYTWLKIAELTNKFMYVPSAKGFYLIHEQSHSNKDMSIPSRVAIAEFLDNIDKKQLYKIEANLNYTSGRYNYLIRNYAVAKKKLMFSLVYGQISIKIKSSIMLVASFFLLR